MSEHQTGGAHKGNVWYRKKGKRWSPSLTHRGDHEGQGLWALGLRCSGGQWGIHSLLHGSSQCLTHVAYGNHARIGSGGDAPGSGLTESVELVSEKTSQKVASTSSAILACQSLCFVAMLVLWSSNFLANLSHSWTSSCLSWSLAQVMLCSWIRARLRLGPSSVCELSFQWGGKGRGRNQQQHRIWQAMVLLRASPQYLLEKWIDFYLLVILLMW